MASSSWCKETDKKINYTKLCRLLVDGGTHAVRSVFDGIHPPSSLKVILDANKTTLENLKKPRGKVLNNEQWDKLYPSNGNSPESEDFDITLLFVLVRNICELTPPATGWDVLPPVTDDSLEANLARIKYYRNNTIAHTSNTEINNAYFEKHWEDITSALVSLGLSQDDIDDLKSAPLGQKSYNQLLYDWYISDKDVKKQLEEVKSDTANLKTATADLKSDTADIKTDTADLKSDTADLKSDTSDIKSDTTDIKTDTADLKSDTSDLKSDTADIKSDTAGIKSGTADMKNKLDDLINVCIEAHKMDQPIQKLAISDFRAEINTKCKSFHPNTRQWILDQVKSHVESDQPDSCIMLITAGPGMGKSTIAAKICQTYKDLGCLAACHFFQFSNSTRNNSRLMLQSIAGQMCHAVPGYEKSLERKLQTDFGKKISEMNCEELLTVLLEEPLCNVEQTDSNLVVVLDALDECSHDPKDELLKALRKKVSCLPSWLRFILTSRPSTNSSALGSIVAIEITAEDQSNIKDLELFFSFELKALYPQYSNDENRDLVQNLGEMTKGLFLVAFFVIEFLKRKNVASPEKVWELFLNGISSVYENYFSRLKEVLLPYIAEEKRFYKMLEAVVATKNPLPKNMFYSILSLKSENEVPRHEKKKRKDALTSLHWLFPVEGDHVTPFHKPVFDWLTLQEDEEHDFSVRVEDGNEVLSSQCNEVISDLKNGKKDMDKPLNLTLTDSEKYALRFLCHLVEERLSVVEADDKYGFFSNIYLQTALKIIEDINFDDCISDGIVSSSLFDILESMTTRCFYTVNIAHDPSCRFFRPPSFGCYLAFVLQAANVEGVSKETTPNPLDALKKHRFPYFYENTIFQTPLEMEERLLLLSSIQYLLKCKVGFIAVLRPISCSNSLSTAVYMFERDGSLIRWKPILGIRLISTSPNINFIVAAEENGNKIEILDATTLEVVCQYQSPHDAIESCHVFEDDQGCFIVIKGCHDNKIYVIEGLTGQLRNTITVNEDSFIRDVSCQGHIVVTRTWESHEPEETKTFINKDGEVELRNWRIGHAEYPSPPKSGLQTPTKQYVIYTYQELLLYHYDRGQEPLPIYPTIENKCPCPYIGPDVNVDKAVHVSEDGRLLAYHYKDSIFIVNTSDGSLFKRCAIYTWISCLNILFVSRSYLVITDQSVMSVINIQTDEIEHRIYLRYPNLPNSKQYLLFPEEDGKSFNLITNHSKPGIYEVSRLVFHNLNLQGLQ